MLTAPIPTPEPTSTLFQRPDIGAATASTSINGEFLGAIVVGVVMVLMIWHGLSLMVKPRKTTLGEAGRSSGVMGLGMFWIGGALAVGAAAILGLFGGFLSSLIR